MIRCAKSDCYPGRNGQNHEAEDAEGSIDEEEAKVTLHLQLQPKKQ